MQSYIDKKYMVHFFESLMKVSGSFSDEEDKRRDILKFFKGKTDMFLDSDFNAIIDKIDKPYQNVILNLINQLTTGRNGTNIYTKQNNSFRNLKNIDLYSKLKQPFASFWLGNKYNHTTEKYTHKNPYYFLTTEDDLSKWESFSKSKTFYIGPNANKKSFDVLSSWNQLSAFSHPFKDIIISDRYCLMDSTGIKENIIPIISNLSEKTNRIENIIFFVKPDKLFNQSLKQTHELLSANLLEKKISTNIIIYKSNKTPHDRFIITNNLFIKSGDSFDYLNKDHSYKTKGTTLNISPIFEANKEEVTSLLKTLKEILSGSQPNMHYGNKSKNIIDLFSLC